MTANNQVAEANAKYLAEVTLQSVPAGYKQTEVGIIPEDWSVSDIENISLVPMQNGLFYEPKRKGKGVPLINVRDMYTSAPIGVTSLDLFDATANEVKVFKVQSGDLFFTRSSVVPTGIAYCNIFPDESIEAVFDSHLIRVRPDQELTDAKYLYLNCIANHARRFLIASAKTATMTTIDQGAIKKCPVLLPPKEEQTAIANALSDVDALITKLEKLIAKKQAIKTATMQQLLTGRTRLPQFALREDGTPKGHKQSELGKIPEDWDAIKMGDLAKIQRGASPRPIDSPIWFNRNSSVGWLRISDVSKTSKYLTETTQNLSELGIANSRFVPANNLVMSICATVGKPIITRKDLCIHDGFVVFNGLLAAQDYMYYVLRDLEDEWGNQGQTGSQMNLNTDLINGTYVTMPSDKEEQIAIATILSDIDAETQALEQRLTKTRQIKQSMMQELLTGKTRLTKGKNL